MKYFPLFAIIICLQGCSLFTKTEDDELFRITEKVMEKKEGIDIIVQPIQVPRK
jgi:hypothetical protein